MAFVESCEVGLHSRVWDMLDVIVMRWWYTPTQFDSSGDSYSSFVCDLPLPNVPPQVSVKIVGAGFFFLVFKATFDLQRILQQFLSTVVAPYLRRVRFGLRNRRRGFGYLSARRLLAMKSIRVRRKPLHTCQHLLQSYTHHRQLWEPCILPQTIQTNRLIEQRLIFQHRIFKTVTTNSSVQNLTRSQRYTEHCKPVVYQLYLLQDEKQDILAIHIYAFLENHKYRRIRVFAWKPTFINGIHTSFY